MKRITLYAFTVLSVLVLAGCTTYDYKHDYYETTQEIGVHACYLAGTEVEIDPLVRVGTTFELIRSSDNEEFSSSPRGNSDWTITELEYVLELEDETNVLVEEDTITDVSIIDSDTFNFGVLEEGEYLFTLTTISTYNIYEELENVGESTPGVIGTETLELTDTIEIFVSEDCGNEFSGTLVLSENGSSYNFYGVDSEGNEIGTEDIRILDNYLSSSEDYFIGIGDYEFSNIFPYYLVYDLNSSYQYYHYFENNFDFNEMYFNVDQWNGNLLYYINQNLDNTEFTEAQYITVQLYDTNIYTDVIVVKDGDTEAPVFSNVPSDMTIELGDEVDFESLMPTALDNYLGDVTEWIESNIEDDSELVVGDNTITYTVEDYFGNEATASFVITVLSSDTEEPVVTVNTELDTVLEQGSTAPDFTSYFTVSDNEDGVITVTEEMLSWDTMIDLNTPGVYTITLSLSDEAGNVSTQSVVFTILDLDPVFGNIPVTQVITEGEFVDLLALGLTANDLTDGDISSSITVDISDTSLLSVGDHTATYSVTDTAGNTVTTSITITVEEATSMYTGTVSTATAIAPSEIDVVFDVLFLDNLAVDTNAFTVVVDGLTVTVISYEILFDNIVLTIDNVISINSVVTVSYTATGTHDLEFDMVKVPNFTDQVVDTTNIGSGGGQGSYTGDLLVASAYDANTIDLVFDVDTLDSNLIDVSAFTVTIDGVTATITGTFVNINLVSLTITETMDEFTYVEVSYSPTGTNDLTYGGVAIASFTNEPVLPPNEGGMPPGF